MRRNRFIPGLDTLPSRIAPSATASPTSSDDDLASPTTSEFGDMGAEDEGLGDMVSDPIGYDPLAPQLPSDWMG